MTTATAIHSAWKVHTSDEASIVVEDRLQQSYDHYKPTGLWYGVGSSWMEWCEGASYYIGKYVYKVNLSKDARILYIKNEPQLECFMDKYGGLGAYKGINWDKVASKYHGVEISPYIYGCRLKHTWYYGWDVASGCIWNSKAVKSIKQVGVTKP